MNKCSNWENVKAATERVQLPKGGYIVKILDARQVDYDWGSKLEVSIDITDGEFKDFYANDYRSQTQEDKKWKGVLRQYIPKDDGSEKDEWTKSSFKAMTDSIEDSNSGYHWDWNESHLKGKIVGCLFRLEEWEMNGREGWKTQPFKFVSMDIIKNAKFKVPVDKPLKNKTVTQTSASELGLQEVESDDDLPF